MKTKALALGMALIVTLALSPAMALASDWAIVSLDNTPPLVTYVGNEGSYTVDQMVSITCSATDDSRVVSDTCEDIIDLAYTFDLGYNRFSATATDEAGNIGTGSTGFTVTVTYDGLRTLTQRFVTNPGVARSLIAKLNAASASGARGDTEAESRQLAAYAQECVAQRGKSLDRDQANTLIGYSIKVATDHL